MHLYKNLCTFYYKYIITLLNTIVQLLGPMIIAIKGNDLFCYCTSRLQIFPSVIFKGLYHESLRTRIFIYTYTPIYLFYFDCVSQSFNIK